MKRAISAILLAGAAFTAAAQTEETSFNGWGVRVGLDISIPGNWTFDNGNSVDMYKNGAGFTAGVVYNLPLVSELYFEPGLSMFYDTYAYKDLIVTDGPGEVVDTNPSIRKFGLRLPLMFGYRFNVFNGFNFSVYTGPELSYALSGKIGMKNPEGWGDTSDLTLFGKNGGYRRFDCGWKIGIGFPIGRWFCGVEGSFGLLDMHKNDVSFHENRVSVSFGYDF